MESFEANSCSIIYPDGSQCDRTARKGSNLCSGHQERRRKYGDPLHGGPLRARRPEGTLCGVGRIEPWQDLEPCDQPHYSLGFCINHYYRYSKHGDPSKTLKPRDHSDICTVEGCTRPWFSMDMCKRHYNTARAHDGDPLGGSRANDVGERLRRRVIDGGYPARFFNSESRHYDATAPCPCRLWTGTVNHATTSSRHKYGVISTDGDGPKPVHRVVYEREVGPIPPGYHLDHLCLQTLCVEPRHLEPVSNSENSLRRWIVVNEILETYGENYDQMLAQRRARRKNDLTWPD